jgi:hypothetical protein
MSRKPYCKKYTCNVYNTEVIFVAGCSKEEFQRVLEQFGINSEKIVGGSAIGYTIQTVGGLNAVWLQKRNPPLSALVHECVHLAKFILDDRGVEYGANGEALCYYTEYWFERFVSDLKKRRSVKG